MGLWVNEWRTTGVWFMGSCEIIVISIETTPTWGAFLADIIHWIYVCIYIIYIWSDLQNIHTFFVGYKQSITGMHLIGYDQWCHKTINVFLQHEAIIPTILWMIINAIGYTYLHIYIYIYTHIRLSTTFCPDLRRGGLTHICLQFSNGNIRFQTMHVRLPYFWPGTSNFDQNPYIARMISGSSPCFAWVSRLLVSQKSLLLLINFHFTFPYSWFSPSWLVKFFVLHHTLALLGSSVGHF